MAYDFDLPVERRGTWSTRWERYPAGVIPLWVADTDFRAPPAVLEAISRRVAHGILGYGVPPDALRDTVIERMQRLYRWRVEPGWVVFVSGVVPGLHLAARHLTRPDQHALVPTPVYHHLKRSLVLAPRSHTDVPLVLSKGRWVWDEAFLASAVKPNSRLLFLCNPQNPGGTIFTREELARLGAFAEKHDLVICSDEIHADILLDRGKPHVPIASLSREVSRRTVTLVSPNKAFGFPGAGCAFAVIENAELRRAFSADHHATVHDPSVFGYEASLAAYLAWIDASGLGVPDPYQYFLERGVAMSPGTQFGAPGFVRLNFGTQRALLEKALERMKKND